MPNNTLQKNLISYALIVLLALTAFYPILGSTAAAQSAGSQSQMPQQIALAMTDDPKTSININWTTLDTKPTEASVKAWPKGSDESKAISYTAKIEKKAVANSTIIGEGGQPITEKNFYSASLKNLLPNTTYYYKINVSSGASTTTTDIKSFTTAPDSSEPYTFIYVSDPQVKDAHAKAWAANLDIAKNKYPNAKFIYIAGDLTDTTANEGQWEGFFNQPGNAQFNDLYSGSLISELPVAATMGNHDGSSAGVGGIASHYTFLSKVNGVPVTYAFDYGAAHFIVLNSEYRSESDLASQVSFLRSEVAKAKTAGKWTIVAMHKTPYSGADHMDDADVKLLRQYLSPVLAELNVDVVLQGHDHVLSRGFVKPNGYKADITAKEGDRIYSATAPGYTPLYYVANCGSTLKFYSPLKDNSWISNYDPVAPDYKFLDIDSAMPQGTALNPLGPCTDDEQDGKVEGYYRAPTFVAVTVSPDSIKFDTYMTGYDSANNKIVKDTFLYDSFTLNKAKAEVKLTAENTSINADNNGSTVLKITGTNIDISKATIKYEYFEPYKRNILNITNDGKITVLNRPSDDTSAKIWAEVSYNGTTYISNPVDIKVNIIQPARINGSDRFETAVNAAEKYYPLSGSVILAADTNDYADGLSAATLAGAIDAPVLLVKTNEIPESVSKYLAYAGVKNVYLLGGNTVISDSVEKTLKDAKYNVTRIAGTDRAETAAKVALKVKELGGAIKDTAVIVNGYAPADAMLAASLAADGMPLLMVNKSDVPNVTKDALSQLSIKNAIIVGDTGVVSKTVIDELTGVIKGSIEQIGGNDRTATALALARKLNKPNQIIVGYTSLADAVSAGYASKLENASILYTQKGQLNKELADYLNKANSGNRAIIFGGTGAVSRNVEDSIRTILK